MTDYITIYLANTEDGALDFTADFGEGNTYKEWENTSAGVAVALIHSMLSMLANESEEPTTEAAQ